MRKVKLDAICIDGGTQCRVVIDQPTVYDYLEHMKEGVEFPPMSTVFDGSTHWLVDGFHRWHAYKLLGIKEVEINYKPGTKEDAVIAALMANSSHGKNLSNEDKRNKVMIAIAIPSLAKKSNYEIAKLCGLSQSFVAAVRDPSVKERQQKNMQKLREKKTTSPTSSELTPQEVGNTSLTSIDEAASPAVGDSVGPDDDEMKATEIAHQADIEMMYKLLESDDALKTAHEEIKRLNHLNAQLELRMRGLMNEKNEAVRMVNKLQKQLDKLKDKK